MRISRNGGGAGVRVVVGVGEGRKKNRFVFLEARKPPKDNLERLLGRD